MPIVSLNHVQLIGELRCRTTPGDSCPAHYFTLRCFRGDNEHDEVLCRAAVCAAHHIMNARIGQRLLVEGCLRGSPALHVLAEHITVLAG